MKNIFSEKYQAVLDAAISDAISERSVLDHFIISAYNSGIEGTRFCYENQFPGVNFYEVKKEFDVLGMIQVSEMARNFHIYKKDSSNLRTP